MYIYSIIARTIATGDTKLCDLLDQQVLRSCKPRV